MSQKNFEGLKRLLNSYMECLYEVIEKTYSSCDEASILVEFINNSIDLFPEKNNIDVVIHSISGTILLNSFKLTQWISFEILCGKYFEAMRDLRFIFEGCVYGSLIEDLIEKKILKRLGRLDLKAEIFRLLEKCQEKHVYDKKKNKVDRKKVRKIIEEFIRSLGLSPAEKKKHVKLYTEILSQPKLYSSMGSLIEGFCNSIGIEEEEEKKGLVELWHKLSQYQHFSYPYLEVACEKPELIFLEEFDEELFKLTLDSYFKTLDFFYAVLAWKFPELGDKIAKMSEWWRKNFKKLTLTEKVLERKRFKVRYN